MTGWRLADGGEAKLRAHPRAKLRRQHPIGPCVVGFDCPAARLAIELDGDQHSEPQRKALGAERARCLSAERVRVIRLGDRDLLTNLLRALEFVREALAD